MPMLWSLVFCSLAGCLLPGRAMSGRRERTAERSSTSTTRKRTRSSSPKSLSYCEREPQCASMDCSSWNFEGNQSLPLIIPATHFPRPIQTAECHPLLSTSLNVKLRPPDTDTLDINMDNHSCRVSCFLCSFWSNTVFKSVFLFVKFFLLMCEVDLRMLFSSTESL